MDKIKKLVTPINIFKLLVAINVIVISSYSIGKADTMSETTRIRLNFLTQLSLISLFLINGVEGVKDEDKTKRYLAFFSFTVAIIMVIINVLIFFKIRFA
ncbi:hypothetical protein [Desulfosporosinus nitroreducens]|uniref:DUF3953 domain-containing protein n=1 Tax=Desulfosporosinus nitroreducens TaxID=2018668 RepID=A0ABT8QZW9_9FIRM|nr:hypothetical protein [Desulfosporosinus nitroreducens]MDO0826039.1 hypothetical protein [Desulfosporosinus nitroreducens]